MDIKTMLHALNERGYTQQEIAEQVGVRQPSVWRWACGLSEPRYSTGKRIEQIYQSITLSEAVSSDTSSSNLQ